MAWFSSGILLMLAAIPIVLCSLIFSDLCRARFIPGLVVLAIALTSLGIGIFALGPAVWHHWLLPLPLSVSLFSALSITFWWRATSPQRNMRRGWCPKCGYNLHHEFRSGCPECGWQRAAA